MRVTAIDNREDALLVLQGAAADLDAAAGRTLAASDRLARAGYEHLAAVTHQAAADAEIAAHVLRRDGFFGGARSAT